ncbi:hypothetical protein [Acidicapsa acidisoli]|uniref:hypothetical protein n=1 Tax=Acidicapsa acidisoli TaxID=1615681 RepID=UPI0021DF4B38|nr:hypothetical protein [Acidicapsa acidisoli]
MNAASHAGETQNENRAGSAPAQTSGQAPEVSSDLLSALTGRDANRDRDVSLRTRRVIMSSLGVLRERKEDKSRVRSVALAVTFVILLLIAPLLWEATDSLIAGEHLGDPGSQLSLWACIVCTTMLGAALVAGWWRKRS